MKTSSELHNNQEQKMAKTLAICVLLALAVSSLATKASPECSSPGDVTCSDDCSAVVLCMGDGAGGFLEEVVETCDAAATPATHCFKPSAACSDRLNSCNPTDVAFECTGVGFFPDPATCFYYYLCSDIGGVASHILCNPADKGFNSTRGFCNLAEDSRACVEGPIPACTSIGQSGPTIENPNLYYICKRKDNVLVPVIYQCSGGDVFNDEMKQCEPEVRRSKRVNYSHF